jgi:cupin superfamily acireductone dioxygenase involved in methionine salvage
MYQNEGNNNLLILIIFIKTHAAFIDEIPKFVDEFKHTGPEILTFFHGHLYFQRRLPDGGISGQKKE